MTESVLQIKNLSVSFPGQSKRVSAVSDMTLDIPRGEITALVGESGSGKSVTAMSILRLIQKPGAIDNGEIWFCNSQKKRTNLLQLSEEEMRQVRGGQIAMIFQEPMTSLNPVFTVGDQITEAILLHQNLDRRAAKVKAIEMLKRVGIPNPETRVQQYPHEMSGGMRQRVMIAMGLSCHPELLIADEPTTALDVTIQAQILELIRKIVDEVKMGVLLITHDLGIVAQYASTVAVMYCGQIVEYASTVEVFKNPKHPYTRGLLQSIPSLKSKHEKYLRAIPGMVPRLDQLPVGCAFQDRCEKTEEDCRAKAVDMFGDVDHKYRCIHAG